MVSHNIVLWFNLRVCIMYISYYQCYHFVVSFIFCSSLHDQSLTITIVCICYVMIEVLQPCEFGTLFHACGTLKCENASICEKAAKCEKISMLNVKICEKLTLIVKK